MLTWIVKPEGLTRCGYAVALQGPILPEAHRDHAGSLGHVAC